MEFFKLQGAGNDFVVFDNRDGAMSLDDLIAITPRLSHRRTGVGADGVMALFPASDNQTAYSMIYRNADGSDAGMCGNGGRCIARLAAELGVSNSHRFRVHNNVYEVQVLPDRVRLHFPSKPTIKSVEDPQFGILYQVCTGTEHVVVNVSEHQLKDRQWLRETGKTLRYDPRFSPRGTNVNFMLSRAAHTVDLVTYERGVENLTLSCGTGSLAAGLVSAHQHDHPPGVHRISVVNSGGILQAEFRKMDAGYSSLVLEGPAEIVFKGKINV